MLAPASDEPHRAEPVVQMRDVVTAWLRARGGTLAGATFADPARPRWTQPASCGSG